MGFFSKLKKEAKRTGKRVTKEVKRSGRKIEKEAKRAPDILASPELGILTFGGSTALAGATVPYQQYELGKKIEKEAKAEQLRVETEEATTAKKLEDEISAEKKRINRKATERMRRRGHGGTVLGGDTQSLLGSVGG